MSGCACAEGYYKIDPRDKVKYLPRHCSKTEPTGRTSKVGKGGDGGEESEGRVGEGGKEGKVCCVRDLVPILQSQSSSSGRGNRASQHRLASVFSSGDLSSYLAKVQSAEGGSSLGAGLVGAGCQWCEESCGAPPLQSRKKQLKFCLPFTTGGCLRWRPYIII